MSEKKEVVLLIKKVILFGIFFAIVFWLINIIYIKNILVHSKLSVSERQFKENAKDTKIIFLGDSHVLASANPKVIKNSFNFSSSGESYMLTYYKFVWALKNQEFRPSVIVLPLDIHSFSSFRKDNIESEWYWMDKVNEKDFFKINKKECVLAELNSLFPMIGNGNNIFYGLKESNLVMGHERRSGDFSKMKNKEKAGKDRVDNHLKDSEVIDKNLLAYYQKILALAQKNDIKIVLVRYPVSAEYLQASKYYIKDRQAHYAYLENISQKYGITKSFDYQNYFEGNEFFEDPDHLNWQGAEKFSQNLKLEIEKIESQN